MAGSSRTFERLFTPAEGGYLYYPHRWSRGYFIPADEMERMRQRVSWAFDGKLILIIVAVVLLGLIANEVAVVSFGLPGLDVIVMGMMAVAGLLAITLCQLGALWRLTRGREPTAPRRAGALVRRDMARAFGWPLLAGTLVVLTGPVLLGLLMIPSAPMIAIPWSLLFGLAWLQLGLVAAAKWRMRRQA